MKNKAKLAIAAALVAAVPAFAVTTPAYAQLTNCTGYANVQTYNSICYAGTSGLQRAWARYTLPSFPGLTFTDYGQWAGPGQWSSANAGNTGRVIAYGRNFSG